MASTFAFSLFAAIFFACVLLAAGVVDESIFAAGVLTDSARTAPAAAAFSCGVDVLLEGAGPAEFEGVAEFGFPSGATDPVRTGSGGGD
jgi:hypothetical protein